MNAGEEVRDRAGAPGLPGASNATERVVVIIVSWNTRDLLQACLRALTVCARQLALEVIVVDNASHDGSADLVECEFPAVRLLRNARNVGYAAGVNQGLALASAPWVLLLGSDTEVCGDAVAQLLEFLRTHPDYAAAAPRLVYPDGRVQRSCARLPTLCATFLNDTFIDRWLGGTKAVSRYRMSDFDHQHSIDVEQPQSTCLLLRSDVVQRVGAFDPDLFVFYNDVDFCKRLKAAGMRIRFIAEAEVVHHHGRSTQQLPDFVAELNVNRVRFFRKHHGWRGVFTVKSWTVVRGIEEALRILFRAPRGQRFATWSRLWRTIRSILAA